MRSRFNLYSILVLPFVLAAAALDTMPRLPVALGGAGESTRALPVVQPPKVEFSHAEMRGNVIAITKSSITINSDAITKYRPIARPMGEPIGWARTIGWVRDEVIPSQKKTFPVCEALALGGFRDDGRVLDHFTYPLSDVKVGDKVSIMYSRVDGTDICDGICIRRRPGGKVPPASGEPADRKSRWHDNANESQANEEKGLLASGKPRPAKVCEGLQIDHAKILWFDPDGPWYVRLMIPPKGCYWPPREP